MRLSTPKQTVYRLAIAAAINASALNVRARISHHNAEFRGQ
jgi:hypothetical protein